MYANHMLMGYPRQAKYVDMISEFKPGNQYHSQYSGIQYMYVHMYGCRSVRISSA